MNIICDIVLWFSLPTMFQFSIMLSAFSNYRYMYKVLIHNLLLFMDNYLSNHTIINSKNK